MFQKGYRLDAQSSLNQCITLEGDVVGGDKPFSPAGKRSPKVGGLLVEQDGTVSTNAVWKDRAVSPRHDSNS